MLGEWGCRDEGPFMSEYQSFSWGFLHGFTVSIPMIPDINISKYIVFDEGLLKEKSLKVESLLLSTSQKDDTRVCYNSSIFET